MARFERKRVLVTGGTTGIGAHVVGRLVEEGADVLATGHDPRRLDAAMRANPKARYILSNAGDIACQARLAAEAKSLVGALDAVIINAGIGIFSTIEDTDETVFDQQMAVNFKGPYFLLGALSPLLAQPASIILVSSIGARIGQAQSSVYAASKAALAAAGRAIAAEWVGRGIRINVLSPGPTRTPLHEKLGVNAEELRRDIGARVAMARLADPIEIATAILFLASDEARFITGTDLVVDGGTTTLWN